MRPRYASWPVFAHKIFDAATLEPEQKPGTPHLPAESKRHNMDDTAYCGINPQMLAWANLAPLLSKPLNNMTLEGVCACWN